MRLTLSPVQLSTLSALSAAMITGTAAAPMSEPICGRELTSTTRPSVDAGGPQAIRHFAGKLDAGQSAADDRDGLLAVQGPDVAIERTLPR